MSLLKKIFFPSRAHSEYWSCSKFAKFITKTFADEKYVKPEALELGEWKCWEELYSVNHPVVYWITEVALDNIQDFITYPYRVFKEIKYTYKNIFISKTHAIPTGASLGDWQEYDSRILNSLMFLLVDFVERDKTIQVLEWETTLVLDEDWGVTKEHPHYGTPTEQAIAASDFLLIYNWWKNKRPQRVDPYSLANDIGLKWVELERRYYEEDDKMLALLLKNRKNMWT